MRLPLPVCVLVVTALVALLSRATKASEPADAGFAQRRALVMQNARDHLLGAGTWALENGQPVNRAVNDIGKHWWPRLFAELEVDRSGKTLITQRKGAALSVAQIITGLCRHAPDYRPPEARNPAIGYLYFSPVGLGWVLNRYPGAVAPEDARVVFEQSLHYAPTLSSLNMFTGQGTENHMLMGRTGGYLICQAIVARGASDPISGTLHAEATQRLAEMREYLLEVAQATYDRGFGEWDSSIYYPYVVACWLGLFDHATDPAVRDASRAVLDWIAATVALRTTAGVFGGAEQRSGTPMKSGESNLDQLAWLWWGGLPGDAVPTLQKQDFSQLVYACLSTYRPPTAVVALALRRLPRTPAQHLETKPSYLAHGSAAVRQQTRVVFYDGVDYTLGSAIARPTGGWTSGDNQDLLWKLVARPAGSAKSAFVVCGPKAREPWRQVAQWRNVLIDVWHIPTNANALRADAVQRVAGWREKRGVTLKRTFPGDTSRDNTVHERAVAIDGVRASLSFTDQRKVSLPANGTPLFLQVENTFLALRPVGVGLDAIPSGGFGGFVLETSSVAEYPTLADFQRAIDARDRKLPPAIDGGHIKLRTLAGETLDFTYGTSGTYVEPEFDWGYGAEKPGGYVLMAQPPFQFPMWPSGEGHGRVPQLRIDGKPVDQMFTSATYAGPWLNVNNRILRVTAGALSYQVDYRRDLPAFAEADSGPHAR